MTLPNNQRQAALVLHALLEQDRSWVLEKLPKPESDQLKLMLEELRSLGIPSDPSLSTQFSKIPTVDINNQNNNSLKSEQFQSKLIEKSLEQENIDALKFAQVETLAAILKSEPVSLVAIFVSSHSWPWQESLFLSMGPIRSNAIRQHIKTKSPQWQNAKMDENPFLHQALLNRIACRYREISNDKPLDAPRLNTLVEKKGIKNHLFEIRARSYIAWCRHCFTSWRSPASAVKVVNE